MAAEDPAQGNRIVRMRPPPPRSDSTQSRLAKLANTDFGRLRTSLKPSDAAIGVALAFCLVYLIGYLLKPFFNWMFWLFLGMLPMICMIVLSIWLSRRRWVTLVRRPRIKRILIEAAIAVPLTLIAMIPPLLFKIEDLQTKRIRKESRTDGI